MSKGDKSRLELPGVLDVGSRKQLFIDHRFIASSENVKLSVNPPVKRPGAVIKSDRPWDAFNLIFFTVAEDEGIYKMWYQAFDKDQWGGPDKRGTPRMCYAVSEDGLIWEKPNLGIVEYEGSKDNNILIENMKTGHVFVGPHGKPEERYKIIYCTDKKSGEFGEVRVGASPDGINWNLPAKDAAPYAADGQQIAFWNPCINKYVVYLRFWLDAAGKEMKSPFSDRTPECRRVISRIEMDDIMAPWNNGEPLEPMMTIVLQPDDLDPPDFDIYTSNTYQYPHAADAYFMFPMVYHHLDPERETTVGNDGVNDTQLCAGRDGIHWMQYDRETYLERGLPGEPDCGICAATANIIRRGNYLYQYHSGWPYTHGGFRKLTPEQRMSKEHWGRSHIGVAVQRLDGFVSANTPLAGGHIVTPPIVFKGDNLQLNINVNASGQAQVELQDENGQIIPGYSLDDCDRIMWNDVAHTVKWRGKPDVSALAGQAVRLRIVMRAAKLYAFQFVPASEN